MRVAVTGISSDFRTVIAPLLFVAGAGHLLFHDYLDEVVPIVTGWLGARISEPAGTATAQAT
jgi:hypothetical protein